MCLALGSKGKELEVEKEMNAGTRLWVWV
jgi:hypothetical protein